MRNPLSLTFRLPDFKLPNPLTFLLFAVILEMALMGSGRMLEMGPITARMLLWLVALCCSAVVLFFYRAVGISTWILLASFGVILSLCAAIGLLHGARLEAVGEDIKPLAYVFLLPFFEIAINSESRLKLFVRTTQFAALIMAVGYFALLGAVLLGYVSFADLFAFGNRLAEQDVTFRGETGMFFYRGFLYVCAGAIFFLFGKSRREKLLALFLMIATVASGTRGLILSLGIVLVLYLMVWSKHRVFGFVLGLALALAWFSIAPKYLSTADREESNAIRIRTLQQISEDVTPSSLFIGHGLGIGVNERPVHMEIAYVEIFHKEGLLGLAWWACFFVMMLRRFQRAKVREAIPFFLCGLLVFVESFTNPFLTNPLGIALILACMASLRFIVSATDRAEAMSHQSRTGQTPSRCAL